MSMMSGNDLNLTATVDANVTGYERHIEQAIRATQKYEASLASANRSAMLLQKSLDDEATAALARQHNALTKTGRAWFMFGAVTAAALGAAAYQAMKWESAWAGVTKTTSGSAEQMAHLEDQLRSLTLVLPSSHEEIAAVAEAAGQLGVRREDIAAFTKTMIDLGQTTNLSADDAATAIAQFMNVMGTVPAMVDHIGNTLVALGNKGASTEAEIMGMAQRVVGAGKLIGASESDILALSSAMANLGIQAQLGGGAVQRVLLIMYTAMKQGGDQAAAFAQLAGVSSKKFATAWETDPIRAFDLLVQGMGHVKDSGGDLVSKLDELGIKGTQNLSVMLRLAGSGDMLTQSLRQSSTAWEKNNALLIEAEKRYGTTEAKVALARNELRDSAIDIGNLMLPAIAGLIGVVSDLGRAWQDLPGPLRDLIVVLAITTAAVSIFGGGLMMAIPKIAAFKVAVSALEAGALKTAGTRLIGLGRVLTGPWGLALAGGVVALGYFAAKHGEASRKVEELRATLDQQTGAITDNTREWMKKKLFEDGTLDAANRLGLNLSTVTDAALGDTAAIAALNGEYDGLISKMPMVAAMVDGKKFTGVDTSSAPYLDLENVRNTLNDTNGTLAESRRQVDLFALADRAASDAQQGTTEAWQDGAAAANDLTGEVQTLGAELKDLSSDYLDNRGAARQVRSSMREIRDGIKQYIKDNGDLKGAFVHGTKSGDDFAGMLDGLAGDLQNQIDTTERVTGSQKAVQRVYDLSRERLMAVAHQIGMTRQEAKDYVDQTLQTPAIVMTHFLAPGLSDAQSRLLDYVGSLNNVPAEIHTRIFQEMQSVPSAPTTPGPKSAPKPKKARADGGFSFGTGRTVAREPQIAPGGADIRWAEPSTGWEAYISGKPGMEDRNRNVWAEAGRRLGVGNDRGSQGSRTTVIVERTVERLAGAVSVRIGDQEFRGYVDGVARQTYRAESDYENAMGGPK